MLNRVTANDESLRSRVCASTNQVVISDDDRRSLQRLIDGIRHTFLSSLAGAVGKHYEDLGKLRNKLERMPSSQSE